MMLDPTDEQLAFRAEVRRYLERSWPTTLTRSAVEGGPPYDADAWAGLARMGATALLVPEEYGGAGAGTAEAAFVAEELGRLAVAAPYLSAAVLAPRLLTALGDTAAMAEHLPGIAEGTTVTAVALLDGRGRPDPDRTGVRATTWSDGAVLDGHAPFVPDLPSANLLLVVAATDEGPGMFALPPDAPGVATGERDCLDRTQPVGALSLDGARATRIGGTDGELVRRAVGEAVAATLACLCLSQVGGAEQCLDLSTTYAGQRIQFGRTIGSYQAVKHRCADMLARVESARSAAHHLVALVDARAEGVAEASALAKAVCSDAYTACASDMLQIHGGIGFTWEHDAHLYFKRARAAAHLYGDAPHHRSRLARRLLVTAAS